MARDELNREQIHTLDRALRSIGDAICDSRALPGQCPTGAGPVGNLTEAVMGGTNGLVLIAEAINNLADAVRHKEERDFHL